MPGLLPRIVTVDRTIQRSGPTGVIPVFLLTRRPRR
jgi:hypothetical protein